MKQLSRLERMTARLESKSVITSQSTPTGAGTVHEAQIIAKQIQSTSSYIGVEAAFPNADYDMKLTLAVTLAAIFRRAETENISLTPFQSTPEGAISYPNYVLETLKARGAVMPETSAGDPTYTKRPTVTLSALSELSHIPKGSLGSVNAHRQHLTTDALELWRVMLVKIGAANPDVAEICDLEQLDDPSVFLDTLLQQRENLDSPLPLERITEWALRYGGEDEDSLGAKVAKHTPTKKGYMRSIAKVWREEYETTTLANYFEHDNLLSIFNTRTTSRRMSRGFHEMVKAVHMEMGKFNDRIKYPRTNYQMYKVRYSVQGIETGLSAEVLMAYCVFLGINPISILQWIAYRETKAAGTWTAVRSVDLRTLVAWGGAISPRECLRFYNAIQQMGLVSDQNLWALQLLHPSFIYKNLPTTEGLTSALGDKDDSWSMQIQEYMETSPVNLPLHSPLASEFDTPFAQAFAKNNVLVAMRDPLTICTTMDGKVASILALTRREEEFAKTEHMSDEEFTQYAIEDFAKVIKGSASSYVDQPDWSELPIDKRYQFATCPARVSTRLGLHYYMQLLSNAVKRSDVQVDNSWEESEAINEREAMDKALKEESKIVKEVKPVNIVKEESEPVKEESEPARFDDDDDDDDICYDRED